MGRAGPGESLVWRKFCFHFVFFFSASSPSPPLSLPQAPTEPAHAAGSQGCREGGPEASADGPASGAALRVWRGTRPPAATGQRLSSLGSPLARRRGARREDARGPGRGLCGGGGQGRGGGRWVPGGGGARRTGREYRCLQQRTCRAPLPGWGPSAGLGPAAPLRPPHGLHVFVASYHAPRPPSYQWFSKGGRFCHPFPLRGFGATPETLA